MINEKRIHWIFSSVSEYLVLNGPNFNYFHQFTWMINFIKNSEILNITMIIEIHFKTRNRNCSDQTSAY